MVKYRINLFFGLLIIAVYFLIISGCQSTSTINPILKEFQILLNDSDLQKIYTHPKEDIYIPITIIYKGDTIKTAKMRIRGDTSRDDPKKSLKIKFKKGDTFPFEKRKINFNAEYSDKSMIRQYLSSITMQQADIPCFTTEFAKLYVNGKFFGLYTKIENVDEKFLLEHNLDPNNNLYKAKKDGACLSKFDDINIKWEKKTNKNSGNDDLKILIENINNLKGKAFANYIRKHFDYNNLISLIAVNMLISNGSTYYHNYYLYHDSLNQKWQIFPWDMDKTFSYYNWMPYDYTRTSSHWESDNPLIEKCILDDEIFSDIKIKISDFHNDFFNTSFFNPIIDKLGTLLKDAIHNDTTDQIESIEKWEKALETEKKYIAGRYDQLQQQFNDWPTSFSLIDVNEPVYGAPNFTWTTSKSNRGKTIKYNLYYGSQFLLKDSATTRIIKNIKDTFFTPQEILPAGKYYWRVEATDGDKAIEGFNTKSIFEVKKMNFTKLPKLIKRDMTLTPDHSPYLATEDIKVLPNVTLSAEPGVIIYLKDSVNIWVNGVIDFRGVDNNNIKFLPLNKFWGFIYIDHPTDKCRFEYVSMVEGILNSKYTDLFLSHVSFTINRKIMEAGENRKAIIWYHKGNFTMENCQIRGNGKGEGININYAAVIIRNNFIVNTPDGIELIKVKQGIVENNWVAYSPDDAIDLDSCFDISIRNNVLYKCKDKGISIGTEQYGPSKNIKATNNLIIGNAIGIGVKDSSEIFINHNTLVNNKIGVLAKIKRENYQIGGYAKVQNSIIYNSESPIVVKEKSKIDVSFSISNKERLSGEKNIFGTPVFENEKQYNFTLKQKSLGKNKGNDKRDIGAFDNPASSKILLNILKKYYHK